MQAFIYGLDNLDAISGVIREINTEFEGKSVCLIIHIVFSEFKTFKKMFSKCVKMIKSFNLLPFEPFNHDTVAKSIFNLNTRQISQVITFRKDDSHLENTHFVFGISRGIYDNENVEEVEEELVEKLIKIRKRNRVKVKKCCSCCELSDVRLSKCSRCNKVRYCSRTCQKNDWKIHKQQCKPKKKKKKKDEM